MNKLHAYPNNNLSKYDRKKLNNGDNLNVKLGPYGSASNDIVRSLLNKPTQVVNGEVTIDWYPSNDNSNYGTQILRHTRDNTINIYFRAKKGSVDNWSEWINLATKDDLTPTSEAIAQPLVSGITFSQWIVTAEKSGNEVTLSFNVNGNMTATSSIVKILTLPTKYRPKSNKYVSYATQEGYIMLLAIYTDGTLNLFNNNKAVSGFFLRQTISYPAE